MIYTIGLGWSIIYFVLALALLVFGLYRVLRSRDYGYSREEKKTKRFPLSLGQTCIFVLMFICIYFWFFAATHFRVPINERSLLINTISQTIVGVREHGVQSKPLLGVSVEDWPANSQYLVPVIMKGGKQSATTANGTSVYDDVNIYLNLSEMDLEGAYKAVNGNWEKFLEKNLLPGLLSVSRSVSQKFSTYDHTTKRDQWEKQYETEVEAYLSDASKGFKIKLVKGSTIMSWDFVNNEDAKAYDDANRAAYKATQNSNELAALKIESQMVDTKNEILRKSADGTIESVRKWNDFLKAQPPEMRPYLMQYLKEAENWEYLRLVSQLKPDTIIPPNGAAIVSTNSSEQPAAQTVPPVQTQPQQNKK